MPKMRQTKMAIGAAASVAGILVAGFGGRLHDMWMENMIVQEMGGFSYELASGRHTRRSQQSPQMEVRRIFHYEDILPDELQAEVHTIARRLGLTAEQTKRLRLAVVPDLRSPASSGAFALPGSHAYIVLPERYVMNYVLSRVKWPEPQAVDIQPDTQALTLMPSERYELAHELSHLKGEDSAMRWLAQGAAVAFVVAVAPLCMRAFGWTLRRAGVASLWALGPAILGLRTLERQQEFAADERAALAGYRAGAIQYWLRYLQLHRHEREPTAGIADLFRTHPPAADRLNRLIATPTSPPASSSAPSSSSSTKTATAVSTTSSTGTTTTTTTTSATVPPTSTSITSTSKALVASTSTAVAAPAKV
eukprot:m.120798 g.120798  ORF g.120798 m.120798 type:complete len:364 (+) comp16184_c0_seq1:851-1942(+)